MMKIHHFGYITKNIGGRVQSFSLLGFEIEGASVFDGGRNILVQFMKNGSIRIELVEPVDESSPFYALLGKYKNGFYHVCYEVDDLKEEMQRLRTHGFVQTTKVLPAPALGGRDVVFLLNPKVGLVELLEDCDEGTGISV